MGVGVVVGFEPDGCIVPLVSSVVPVYYINEGGETAHHERNLPETAVVDLSRSRTYHGEGSGGFDGVLLCRGIVDDGVAEEVDIGGYRRTDEYLSPGVVLYHFRLYRVEEQAVVAEVAAAHQVVVLVLVSFVLLVLLDAEEERRPRRGVQYRYFPVIAVVKLSEPRRYQRNGRQGGYLEGIPEKRTVAVERGIGPSLQAFHLTALTCRERSQAVGHCQGVGDRHRKRIGTARRQYACSQRVGGFPDHRQQRIGGYDDFGIRIGRAFFAARNPVCVLTQFRQGERRVFSLFPQFAPFPPRKGLLTLLAVLRGFAVVGGGRGVVEHTGRFGLISRHLFVERGFLSGPQVFAVDDVHLVLGRQPVVQDRLLARLDERFGDVVLECRHFRVGQGRLVLQRRTVFTGLLSGAEYRCRQQTEKRRQQDCSVLVRKCGHSFISLPAYRGNRRCPRPRRTLLLSCRLRCGFSLS